MPIVETIAEEVVELDPVAHADRPLEEQDHARDEVVDHVLQPEADADAQRAEQQGHPIEGEADRAHGDHEADHEDRVAGEGGEREGHAGRHAQPG